MTPNPPPDFREVIGALSRTRSSHAAVFGDFCRVAACCFALGTREEEYLEVAARYTREELDALAEALGSLVLEMERKPFEDVLGPHYLEVSSKATQDARGEFYTPREVSRAMARMLFDSDKAKEENRAITVLEPAAGAGGMVLALGELMAPAHVSLLRVTCWDVNPVAADMCYLNTTLWGIPAHVVWGDTLRRTVHRSWKNLHWARTGEDARRAFETFSSSPSPSKVNVPADREELSREVAAQLELGL